MNKDEIDNEIPQVGLYLKNKINLSKRPKIDEPQKVFNIIKAIKDFEKEVDYKEVSFAVYVNQTGKLLSVIRLAEGTDTAVVMCPKQIVQAAILQNATGVLLCHNHPSEDLTPSNHDIAVTEQVKNALSLFSIKLKDHLIINSFDFFSFAENRLILTTEQ